VFRIFHEISGYNIVLDPSVRGTSPSSWRSPRDQALDIILKNNGLDKIFENNVIRIASTSSRRRSRRPARPCRRRGT
jgi:type IV pilus assembly protein PilQ